jgi:hypothetical protein
MLRRADSALYAAKHAGRNCVRVEPPFGSTTNKSIETASDKEEIAAIESLV